MKQFSKQSEIPKHLHPAFLDLAPLIIVTETNLHSLASLVYASQLNLFSLPPLCTKLTLHIRTYLHASMRVVSVAAVAAAAKWCITLASPA
jgi:hypothetical protein